MMAPGVRRRRVRVIAVVCEQASQLVCGPYAVRKTHDVAGFFSGELGYQVRNAQTDTEKVDSITCPAQPTTEELEVLQE